MTTATNQNAQRPQARRGGMQPGYHRSFNAPPPAQAAPQNAPADNVPQLLPRDESPQAADALAAAIADGPAAQARWLWQEMKRRGYNAAHRDQFYKHHQHLIDDARFNETAALFEQESKPASVPTWAR